MAMKLSIKDCFLLFVSLIITGIGMIPEIQSIVGYTLIIIGSGGVIFTLGFNIYRTRIKTKNEEDNSDYFPHLKINMLKEFAKRLRNKYNNLPIISIALCRYHTLFNDVTKKYAILILVDSSVKNSDKLMDQFGELQHATGWLGDSPSPDSARDLGIDISFEDIYKEKPEKDYLKEWALFVIALDDKMPKNIETKEKKIILYQPKLKRI
jgi:hypothetical protein